MESDCWEHLEYANRDANPELLRLALKLATGAGKTTVMAMLIAWQTVNAVHAAREAKTSRGVSLVVTPGITIKDRLRVLQPNDPDAYYASRELVPNDMLDEVNRAKIVITNYHAFKLRERLDVSGNTCGPRRLARRQARHPRNRRPNAPAGDARPDGHEEYPCFNDEAHHCYREKPEEVDDEALKGDEKKEAEKNNEAARLWISGLEAVNRKLGLARVLDLSATPFFLRGSGYAEGTLFPWTMSDFSLMDAIECGIVKLPRVPVADNIPGDRNADVPQSLGTHRKETCQRKGEVMAIPRSAKPTAATPDRPGSPLRPLRENLQALGRKRHSSAALLHYCLPKHSHLQAGVRFHLRFSTTKR